MKFKKCISLFLAFFLLFSNVGLAFNVHYCGDTIASVSLKSDFSSPKTEENCCGIDEKENSCCKDKVVNFQKKSDNFIEKGFSFQSDAPFVVQEWNPFVSTAFQHFNGNKITTYFCDANAPPLFKLYSQYIFYA